MNMIADYSVILTFSELRQLCDEDLAMCVSKEDAVKICRKSIECTEAAANEVLHLWVHKLNKIYEVEHSSAQEWQQLTAFFAEIVQQLIATATSGDRQLEAGILDVLSDVLELLQWLQKSQAQLGFKKFCITLHFVLQTVSLFFAYCKNGSPSCDLHKILQHTLILYNLALQVLSEIVDICKIDDSEELTQLTEVQEAICILVEDVPPIHLKSIIETWKCVTKLTIHCAKLSFTLNNESLQHIIPMASRPLTFLLQEIRRSLNIMYREETLRQPMEQVEKYLRITNFYLKLLQLLADALRHERFPLIAEFMEIFITSQSPPKYLSNSELANIAKKYVLHDLCEVFNMIYKNPQIIEMLSDKSCLLKSPEFNIIGKEFLRATLVDKTDTFINEKIDLYFRIYRSLTTDVQNFCDSNVYNEIVEQFAALAIINSAGMFKKYLRSAILREDFLLAHTSMDVLLTIARSSQTKPDELLLNFRYWQQCNKNFALFTSNPRELQVCLLLLHYYKLCQARALINKTDIYSQEFADSAVLSSAYRLFIALPETSNLMDNNLRKVFLNLDKGELPQSVDNYYKMLVQIKCLFSQNEPREETERDATLRTILRKTLNIVKTLALNLRPFSRLLAAVLELHTKYFQQLDEPQIASIVNIFKQHAAKIDDCVALPALYTFLDAAQVKSQNFERFTEEVSSDFADKPNARLLQSIFILNKLENIENCKINTVLYSPLNLKPFIEHNCKLNINHQSPPSKRLRIEGDGALKFMLNDMLEKSLQLLNSNVNLEVQDLHLVNSIKNNLTNILSNHAAENAS